MKKALNLYRRASQINIGDESNVYRECRSIRLLERLRSLIVTLVSKVLGFVSGLRGFCQKETYYKCFLELFVVIN